MKGAIISIEKLSKNYDLMVITSRPDIIRPETILWIESYFPKKFSYIEFTGYWAKKERKDKASVCMKHRVKVLIDDYPEFLLKFSEKGKAILFDAPWNQDFKSQRIKQQNPGLSW